MNRRRRTVPTSKRSRLINYWRGLKPNLPLYVHPIAKDAHGDTYHEDTLRLTGSPEYITSVIARLKDYLAYDNQNSKLEAQWVRHETPKQDGTWSYSLYIRVRSRQ